jgi:hypothetical protein
MPYENNSLSCQELKEDAMVDQPRKVASAKASVKSAKPGAKKPGAKKPVAKKPGAEVADPVAKKVTITSVSPGDLIIGGGPTFVYLNGSGFNLFKPQNPNESPKGRFEAYIIKSNILEEDKELIEIIQPISSSITDTIFPIEVTVLSGADPGGRRVGIRNKTEKFSDCVCSETCFVTAAGAVTLK